MDKIILKIASICFIATAISRTAMADVDAYQDSVEKMATKTDYANIGGITTEQKTFSMSVTSTYKDQAPRRSYTWDSDGNFTITVTYANDSKVPMSQNGGSRSFFILPPDGAPSITDNSGGGYKVKSSGFQWSISSGSPQISLPDQCKGQVVPPTRQNQGGVNIQSCDNKLVIDSGFGTGSGASLNKARQTIIHDPQGHSCSVANSEVYKYDGWHGYDVHLKFQSPTQWASFLRGRCTNLNVGFLLKGPPSSSSSVNSPSPASSSSSGGIH